MICIILIPWLLKSRRSALKTEFYPGRFVVYIKYKPRRNLMLGNVFKSTFLFSMKYVFRSFSC